MAASVAAATRPPVFVATYSNVPVYEFRCRGVAVMRRRIDNYINATHILKAAEYDKPQRTKILEREIHTGPHEKVQGGYGKYQGTWVTLERGRVIARQHGVGEVLAPLLDFDPAQWGESELVQAPKHRLAVASRPKGMSAGAANAGALGEAAGGAAAGQRRAVRAKPVAAATAAVPALTRMPSTASATGAAPRKRKVSSTTPGVPVPRQQPQKKPAQKQKRRARSESEDVSDEDDDVSSSSLVSAHRPNLHATSGQYRYAQQQHRHNAYSDSEDEAPQPDHHYAYAHAYNGVAAHHSRKRKRIGGHGEDAYDSLSDGDASTATEVDSVSGNMADAQQNRAWMIQSSQNALLPGSQHSAAMDAITQAAEIEAFADRLFEMFVAGDYADKIHAMLNDLPSGFRVDHILDDDGHTALHWAAATGSANLVQLLIEELGADPAHLSAYGHTPLMRSVLFSNNYDRRSFPLILRQFASTIPLVDPQGRWVLHLIAETARSRGKVAASRFYLDCVLDFLRSPLAAELPDMPSLQQMLDWRDTHGDTALHVAARVGNKIMVRRLQDAGASLDLDNADGRTAGDLIKDMEARLARPVVPGPGGPAAMIAQYGYDGAVDGAVLGSPAHIAHGGYVTYIPPIPARPYHPPPPPQELGPQATRFMELMGQLVDSIHASHLDQLKQLDEVIRRLQLETAAAREETLHIEGRIKAGADDDGAFERELDVLRSEEATLEAQLRQQHETEIRSRIATAAAQEVAHSASAMTLEHSPANGDDRDSPENDQVVLGAQLKEVLIELSKAAAQWTRLRVDAATAHGKLADYRRLVSLCLDVPEPDLEGMLDGLLGSMSQDVEEEEQREIQAGPATGAGVRMGDVENGVHVQDS